MEETIKRENKKITILGISLWEILAYFIIYSIAGYFIETGFALIRYGVLESRQSFLYGPFCGIYGLGAVVMIIFLQYFKRNWATLFGGGLLIGSVTEYLVSLIGELILNVKWWDYSNMPFNIGGRICISYSMFWGILAIFLMRVIHPRIRNFMAFLLKKSSTKIVKTSIAIITIFMLIDCIISGYAINLFTIRMVAENNLNVENKEMICQINNELNKSEFRTKLRNTFFSNEKMIKTYPNLKVEQLDGSIIYFKDLLPDIKPYFFKFSHQDFYK